MPNQDSGNTPSTDSQQHSVPQSPVTPAAPHQGTLSKECHANPKDNQSQTTELAREFRIAEKWQIGTNVGLGVIGIFALFIYYGQLCQMRKATEATKIAAEAAKQSADLTRKQLEGTGAAVIEQYHMPSVDIDQPRPVAAFNLINRGHFIAHDIHLRFVITVRDANTDRVIGVPLLSKEEIISQIPPSGEIVRPDHLYFFKLRTETKEKILKTMEYIAMDGIVDYDNGFDVRYKQPFCYAYIPTGGQGTCDQAQMIIRNAREQAKKDALTNKK